MALIPGINLSEDWVEVYRDKIKPLPWYHCPTCWRLIDKQPCNFFAGRAELCFSCGHDDVCHTEFAKKRCMLCGKFKMKLILVNDDFPACVDCVENRPQVEVIIPL